MIKHTLHLKAPGNWINDPNGFIYYKGNYHLFYQYFPYAPVWGTMHWGHAVSRDLVHWEHVGVALFPTRMEDKNGCFSGCALEQGGKLNLYYTGVMYEETEAENIHVCVDNKLLSSQLMLTSEDGVHFDNFTGKTVVIPTILDEETGDKRHTRDPKVWEEDGQFYMALGSTYRGETGRVLFYRSSDARNWRYVSQFRGKMLGVCLECPDLFRVGGRYVFIGSPMDILREGVVYRNHAICMLAEFDAGTCTMTAARHWQYVDYGMDLYAPQTNLDRDGRRVMVAWMRMPETVEDAGQTPWNGMMCLPRVVEVKDGHSYFRVHPETDAYFTHKVPAGQKPGAGPYRIKTTLKEGESLDIGGYKVWVEEDCVMTDRSKVFSGIEGHLLTFHTPELNGEYRLDLFVDENLVEVFVNDGQYVISNIVYGLGDFVDGHIDEIWQGEVIQRWHECKHSM